MDERSICQDKIMDFYGNENMLHLIYYESEETFMNNNNNTQHEVADDPFLKNWYDCIDDFIAGDISQKEAISKKANDFYCGINSRLYFPMPPKSLYRYFKFDKEGYWLKNIKGYLHLAPPISWNDLSDSICNAKLFDNLSTKDKEVADVYSNNRWACCFTEQIDYQPHWAYYADNHHGYAIEYDYTTRDRYRPLPIYYTEKIISFDSIKGLCTTKNNEIEIRMFPFPMYIKNPDWRHEKEWRLVDWRSEDGSYPCGIDDESKHIKSIIFGARTKEAHIDATKQLLSEYPHIKLYQMKLERENNRIIKMPI